MFSTFASFCTMALASMMYPPPRATALEHFLDARAHFVGRAETQQMVRDAAAEGELVVQHPVNLEDVVLVAV